MPLPTTLTWTPAGDDVFVATASGEYAGFIAVTSDGFEAQSAQGSDLGTHPTLDEARAAVATSVPATAAAAPAGVPARRAKTPANARLLPVIRGLKHAARPASSRA